MCPSSRSNEPEGDADPAPVPLGNEDKFAEDYNEPQESILKYNHKKPKWWSRLSGNPTKAQKRATNELFQTHRLPQREYGSLLDWNSIFSPDKDIWLEIGFGRGENLLALVHRKKDENISFVGSEINKSAMGTVCRRIQKGLESGVFWSDYVLFSHPTDLTTSTQAVEDVGKPDGTSWNADELGAEIGEKTRDGAGEEPESVEPYQNLRLYPGDAVKLFPYIPSSSLATILVTFPDPFPEDYEKEWRVVQVATLHEIHRILRKSPSPGFFFLATDHEGYNVWSHEVMDEVNRKAVLFEKVEPCPNRMEWLPAVSRYEHKGWEEGRRTMLSCWTVKESEDIHS
jgi:tRNA G46 methylase TrmB